jgi:hypothetical protein
MASTSLSHRLARHGAPQSRQSQLIIRDDG